MNLDDLTLGQLKELQKLTTQNGGGKSLADFKGKWVICRSRNEGVNFGKVVAHDETGVLLEAAQRLWYHKPAEKSMSWYEGVALSGLSTDSKISHAVEQKLIIEDYSLIPCSEFAASNIQNHTPNAQK